MHTEIWKTIPGYPTYEVSSLGKVRSLYCPIGGSRPGVKLRTSPRPLKPALDKYGYEKVAMRNHLNAPNSTPCTVHKLVMLAFVGPRPVGMQINHIDGNKANNCIENLEYCTASENIRHGMRIGLFEKVGFKKGEKHPDLVLSLEEANQIKALLLNGGRGRYIAKEFNVSEQTICAIKRGRHWSCRPEYQLIN